MPLLYEGPVTMLDEARGTSMNEGAHRPRKRPRWNPIGARNSPASAQAGIIEPAMPRPAATFGCLSLSCSLRELMMGQHIRAGDLEVLEDRVRPALDLPPLEAAAEGGVPEEPR